MAKKEYLPCGNILTAHGIRGTLRVASRCDSPAVLASLPRVYLEEGGAYLPREVAGASLQKGAVLLTLTGIADRNTALSLRGRTLYAARADIPVKEGGALIADMLGLPVWDADSGRRYGTLADVQPAPASDLYDILTPDGAHVLLPAVPAFVCRIDVESGVYIRPIPGFFDGQAEEVRGDAL